MQHFRPILTIIVLLLILVVIAFIGNYAEAPVLDDAATTTPNTPGTLLPLPARPGTTPDDSGAAAPGTKTVSYAFEATLPTPCHRLSEPDVRIAESYPEQVSINYEILPPAAGTMCAQVITTIEMTDSVRMPASAIVSSVSVDGEQVAFTILR